MITDTTRDSKSSTVKQMPLTPYLRVCLSAAVMCIAGILAVPEVTLAQVNTEKLRRSDSTTGFFFQAGTSLGLVRGNSEYVSANVDARVDFAREGNDNFLVGNYRFKESSKGKIANKGFLHARSMWETSEFLTLEGFFQVEFNEFLSLNNRNLLGGGVRMHAVDLRGKHDASILDIYLGIGGMFEHELYVVSAANVRRDAFRSTNYLTISWHPRDAISLSVITYLQPSLRNFDDVRMTTDAAMEFKIFEQLFFNVRLSYRYHSRPMTNVEKYDLELSNGLRISLP